MRVQLTVCMQRTEGGDNLLRNALRTDQGGIERESVEWSPVSSAGDRRSRRIEGREGGQRAFIVKLK